MVFKWGNGFKVLGTWGWMHSKSWLPGQMPSWWATRLNVAGGLLPGGDGDIEREDCNQKAPDWEQNIYQFESVTGTALWSVSQLPKSQNLALVRSWHT